MRITRRHRVAALAGALAIHVVALAGLGAIRSKHPIVPAPHMVISIQKVSLRESAPLTHITSPQSPVEDSTAKPATSKSIPPAAAVPKRTHTVAKPLERTHVTKPARTATSSKPERDRKADADDKTNIAKTESSSRIRPQSNSAVTQNEVVHARYVQLLAAWLDKHKYYPRRAVRLGLEDTVIERIRIARDGSVIAHKPSRPAAYSIFTSSVEEMVERADPFPPIPDQLTVDTLEFEVPVRFTLPD